MKNLFLTSSFADALPTLERFKTLFRGKSVTFINTASKVEEMTNYIEEAKSGFQKLEMTIQELDISEETAAFCREVITKNDIIYIAGGNTFFLMQEINKKRLTDFIKESILAGKLYIGESAGSIIMSPEIEHIALLDDQTKGSQLESFAGLGIISDYILPHVGNPYLEFPVNQIINTYYSKLPLILLKDTDLLYINNDQKELITV